jgi:hypothetical protein
MGYVIKENQGLLITRLTDVGRRKISEGNFNVSYFQIGDSEVNYNTIPDYNISNFQILEPSFNAHNNVGVPQSNKKEGMPLQVDFLVPILRLLVTLRIIHQHILTIHNIL